MRLGCGTFSTVCFDAIGFSMQFVSAVQWVRVLVRLKGFQKLTPVDEALRIFFDALRIKKPRAESVSLDSALNRVLAEPVVAREDLPRVDRSAVDGYAVIAEDTVGASQFKPKMLTLTDRNVVTDKQARQLWTGNPVPKGADAVMMLENTKQVGNQIEIWTPLAVSENVSRKGEDVKKGETALAFGIRLKPQHLGMLAALGITEVKVYERPKVAILATGDELVEIGSTRRSDQVFDVNRHVVSALCKELGAEPVDLGIVKDDFDEILGKLKDGLGSDMVITTGGTSVGGSDLVPEAVSKLGKPGVLVHGVAMRPAMPTALAAVEGKPVLVLSGNPVAAMFGFEVFAKPLLSRLQGLAQDETRPTVEARMSRKATGALGRRTYLRVLVSRKEKGFVAEPISARGSGILSTMTKANGYVIIPENREGLREGETVSVHLLDNIGVAD
jgi:molybdopterin molybdotransferase